MGRRHLITDRLVVLRSLRIHESIRDLLDHCSLYVDYTQSLAKAGQCDQ